MQNVAKGRINGSELKETDREKKRERQSLKRKVKFKKNNIKNKSR